MCWIGIADGWGAARCVFDRYDEDTLSEKPRTTLWEEESSALVSDPAFSRALQSLSGLLRGAVDAEESEERGDM